MLISVNSNEICNEKEQDEQEKIDYGNFEKKRSTRKKNGVKSSVQEDKQINKFE